MSEIEGIGPFISQYCPGSLYGARTFLLTPRSLRGSIYLRSWTPGINTAYCYSPSWVIPPRADVNLRCACGFYGLFKLDDLKLGTVLGIIKGWGKTVIGELGFRCSQAQIVALAPSPLLLSEVVLAPNPQALSETISEIELIQQSLALIFPDVPFFQSGDDAVKAFPLGRVVV
jgi:hypothetical protein